MMIVMRHDLNMRKGKIAAQAGHASTEALLVALKKEGRLGDIAADEHGLYLSETDKEETPLSEWFKYGCAKVCVYVKSEEELLAVAEKAKAKGITVALICDAGMTEFHGEPTLTCLAFEPLATDVADEITGELPLY